MPMNPRTKRALIYVAVLTACIVVIMVIVLISIKAAINPGLKNLKSDQSFHQLKNPDWYRGTGNFPEAAFPVPESFKTSYDRLVSDGYAEMRERRIVISGLARDIKPQIKKTLKFMLQELGPKFRDFRIVVYENDSDDGTRKFLEKMQRLHPDRVVVVPCDVPNCVHTGTKDSGLERYLAEHKVTKPKSPSPAKNKKRISKPKKPLGESAVKHGIYSTKRFWKMAYFRNKLTEYIREHYADYDFCMSFDWDIKGAISLDGFATNFGYLRQGYHWDAISAMGLCGALFDSSGKKLSYYDALAYVPYGKKELKQTYLSSIIFTHQIYKMPIPERGTPPIQVASAFGGCAIYQMAAILDERNYYSGENCEHVVFHRRMAEHGQDKIFINPSFVMLHTMTLAASFESPFERFLFSTVQ